MVDAIQQKTIVLIYYLKNIVTHEWELYYHFKLYENDKLI